ncbi:MAG: DUF6146 family protein [Bacteroidota bacterium]
MKFLYLFIIVFSFLIFSCGNTSNSTKTLNTTSSAQKQAVESIRISNEDNFEVTFFDKGFYNWLKDQDPKTDFYESSLEIKNLQYVSEWNRRVANPSIYDKNLYNQKIDYKVNPDNRYGLEVNYELYQYFRFFEQKHEVLLKK